MYRNIRLVSIIKSTIAVAMIGILTGCAVPFPVYTISTNNISAIRNADRQIEVGEFQGGPSSVSCRLQPISPDGGKTFAKYIQDAFKDEIIVANARALPTVKVTAVVKSVDVDCAIVTGSWSIEMEVAVNGAPPFTVKTNRAFDGNLLGAVVLQRAYQAFVPTVQEAVTNILNSQAYQVALKRK